jgi:biopolymer transport protein ExbD
MGGAASGNDEGGLLSDINVTPLVDITLVLLIIFMVAAPLIASAPSIKLQLPRATSADEAQPSTLTVALQRDPARRYRLFVDGREGDDALLRGSAAALLARSRDPQAVIAADEGIAYGDVVHVLDVVKAAGVRRLALDTERPR